MRVLVTGGSGFIGSNLIPGLQALGCPVLNIDIKAPQDAAQSPTWRKVDLMDAPAVRAATQEFLPTHVVHLGARTDLDETKDISGYAVNYEGTRHIIEAAQACGSVERILIASTRLVCRIGYQPRDEFDYQPTTIYGKSKILAEKLTRELDPPFSWCLMRFTSIWGPWFSVPYADFFLAVARGHYIHPRGRRILKSFGFVGNTVHQVTALLQADLAAMNRRTLYVGDSPPLEVFEWAQLIAKYLGNRPTREVPMALLKAAALAGDAAKGVGVKRVPLTSFRLANLLTEMVYDVSPVMSIAGELPYSLEEGVKATVAWARKHGKL